MIDGNNTADSIRQIPVLYNKLNSLNSHDLSEIKGAFRYYSRSKTPTKKDDCLNNETSITFNERRTPRSQILYRLVPITSLTVKSDDNDYNDTNKLASSPNIKTYNRNVFTPIPLSSTLSCKYFNILNK